MPYRPEHKQETRERIVNSARRLFNRKGFAEVTIDEIMADAGLTHGGFYKHFNAKEELYAEAILQFLCLDAPEPWQSKHVDACAQGPELARMIVNAYLSREHFEDREGGCPLVALPSDVARGGEAVKAAYRQVLNKMVVILAASLPDHEARKQALALVATCIGGILVARAVGDSALAGDIRDAVRRLVFATMGWEDGQGQV
jgi:AcrR family transcriptional regulator